MSEDTGIPVNYCGSCQLVHPPMIACSQAQAENMLGLLERIGARDSCRGCNRTIFWVHHVNGKNAPYTEAGLNHFIDCPKRDDFKRKA